MEEINLTIVIGEKIKQFHVYSSKKGDFLIKQAQVAISEIFYKSDKFSLASASNVYPSIHTHMHAPHTHSHIAEKSPVSGNIPTYVLVLLVEHGHFNKNILWLC